MQATSFSHRLWISTTNKWSSEARFALQNLAIPVSKLNLADLESASVDWEKLEHQVHGSAAVLKDRELRKHQQKALDCFHEHFKTANRGRLIMACGTGENVHVPSNCRERNEQLRAHLVSRPVDCSSGADAERVEHFCTEAH